MTMPVRSGRSTSQGKERSVGVKMTQQTVINYGGKIGGEGEAKKWQGELNVETKHWAASCQLVMEIKILSEMQH